MTNLLGQARKYQSHVAGMRQTPQLLIWGRHDPVIPLRVDRKAAALVPGSQLAVLDTGHVPHVSDPEAGAAAMMPFADAVFGPGPAAPSATGSGAGAAPPG